MDALFVWDLCAILNTCSDFHFSHILALCFQESVTYSPRVGSDLRSWGLLGSILVMAGFSSKGFCPCHTTPSGEKFCLCGNQAAERSSGSSRQVLVPAYLWAELGHSRLLPLKDCWPLYYEARYKTFLIICYGTRMVYISIPFHY